MFNCDKNQLVGLLQDKKVYSSLAKYQGEVKQFDLILIQYQNTGLKPDLPLFYFKLLAYDDA